MSTAPAAPLAPIALSPLVVVFDYGDVISRAPSDADRRALRERAGVGDDRLDEFGAAYWAHRQELDAGTLPILEYWQRVARDLGADWSETDAVELWALDHRSWLSVEPGTLRVVQALRAGGTRLALLSNAAADYSGWLRHGAFGGWFERVFVSGELGIAKPDPRIYEHALEALGIAPAHFYFVDNKSENVAAIRELGGDGHVFTDPAALERALRSLV